jgi:hypothetical protein
MDQILLPEHQTFGMNSVMDQIVDANGLYCAWIKLCSWMITTHAFDDIDEFGQDKIDHHMKLALNI